MHYNSIRVLDGHTAFSHPSTPRSALDCFQCEGERWTPPGNVVRLATNTRVHTHTHVSPGKHTGHKTPVFLQTCFFFPPLLLKTEGMKGMEKNGMHNLHTPPFKDLFSVSERLQHHTAPSYSNTRIAFFNTILTISQTA